MNQTVIRLRAPKVTDAYNNETYDWDNPDRLPVTDCSLQPSDTQEETTDRQTTLSLYRLYVLGEPDVLAVDRIEYKNIVYEVRGEPQKWPDPVWPDVVHHTEMTLRQISPKPEEFA